MTASEPATPAPLKSVLVPADFSKGADAALKRALLLPLAPHVHSSHLDDEETER